MPDIRLYLPDNLYMRLKKEENMSKLVQKLLKQYWKKIDKKEGEKNSRSGL